MFAGLSFSVPAGQPVPSSLKNMYKEIATDCGCTIPQHGSLVKVCIFGTAGLLCTEFLADCTQHPDATCIQLVQDIAVQCQPQFADILLAQCFSLQWAKQGVLLLNVCLTVRAHQANSHAKQGWEQFTDAAIGALNRKKRNVVFLLWGKSAEIKAKGVDRGRHHILTAAHPSGLSANRV